MRTQAKRCGPAALLRYTLEWKGHSSKKGYYMDTRTPYAIILLHLLWFSNPPKLTALAKSLEMLALLPL